MSEMSDLKAKLPKPFLDFLEKLREWLRSALPSSWLEGLLFVTVVGIIMLVVQLYRYASIQQQARAESRCYKARKAFRKNRIYTVNAMNGMDVPLYKLTYNVGGRDVTFDCACPSGKTANRFKDVPVYDMKSNERRTLEKTCLCDKDYTSRNEPVYYQGYPGLIRFMSSGDEQFFKQDT
jgi:hypothetical protein